jgi:hypothetical protein
MPLLINLHHTFILCRPPNRAGRTPLLILFLAGITLAVNPLHFIPLEEGMDQGVEEEDMEEAEVEVEVGEEVEAEEEVEALPAPQALL